MDLRGYLTLLRRRWLTITIIAISAIVAAGVLSVLATREYKSTTSVFFTISFGSSANDLAQGSTYAQSQVTTYAELARLPAVLEPVVDELGLDVTPRQLASQVSASVQAGTVIIDITVSDTSAQRAADIANAIAGQLKTTVEELAPTNEAGDSLVQVTSVAKATPPEYVYSPNTKRNLLVGLLTGLLAGVGLVLLRNVLDTRVRGRADVHRTTDLPVLGSIGVLSGGSRSLVVQDAPSSTQAEAYRQIRTNLQFLGVNDQAHSIVITSALPDEGKSTIAANLAIALAETAARVLLIDADLRRPSIADLMSLEGAAGLTTVLIGRADFAEVVQEWGDGHLDVLTSGDIPPNPSELLASPAMSNLLAAVEDRYDVILLDSAPLLPVTDAAILSRLALGTIVVANAKGLRRQQLADGLLFLKQVEARVLGIVLNQAHKESESYGYTQLKGKSDTEDPWRAVVAEGTVRAMQRRSLGESLRGGAAGPGTVGALSARAGSLAEEDGAEPGRTTFRQKAAARSARRDSPRHRPRPNSDASTSSASSPHPGTTPSRDT